MAPVKPTPEMELARLRAELVGLHRALRSMASRWDARGRVEGEAMLRCAQELRGQLDCTPSFGVKDFERDITRSPCGAVVVDDWVRWPIVPDDWTEVPRV